MSNPSLLKMAREFRRGILGNRSSWMMCFAICSPLSTLLEIGGIENELTECEVELMTGDIMGHFFLTLKDGRILDPTADQFYLAVHAAPKLPRVYLGPRRSWYNLEISA